MLYSVHEYCILCFVLCTLSNALHCVVIFHTSSRMLTSTADGTSLTQYLMCSCFCNSDNNNYSVYRYWILCFVLCTLSTAIHCVATFHTSSRIFTSTAHGMSLIQWLKYWSCFCNSDNNKNKDQPENIWLPKRMHLDKQCNKNWNTYEKPTTTL